ncbi:hypothetical protein, partial [Nonomuraea maheshkhaliensis]|uniref:hypothetical protein n=1 Tax=Nonomuraea maheshkhaliensis TaxID=419590 RepID=UPI0031F7E9B9
MTAGEGAADSAGAVRHPGRLHAGPDLTRTVRRLGSAGREAAGLMRPEGPTGLTALPHARLRTLRHTGLRTLRHARLRPALSRAMRSGLRRSGKGSAPAGLR